MGDRFRRGGYHSVHPPEVAQIVTGMGVPEAPRPNLDQTGSKAKTWLNMANQFVKNGDLANAKVYANRILVEYSKSPEADDARALSSSTASRVLQP